MSTAPTTRPVRSTALTEYHEFDATELLTDHEQLVTPGEERWTRAPQRIFDPTTCITKVRAALRPQAQSYGRFDITSVTEDWSRSQGLLGQQEASFWIFALTHDLLRSDTREQARIVGPLSEFVRGERVLDKEEAIDLLQTRIYGPNGSNRSQYYNYEAQTLGVLGLCFRELFGASESLELFFDKLEPQDVGNFAAGLGPCEAEREAMIEVMHRHVDPKNYANMNYYERLWSLPHTLKRAPDADYIRGYLDAMLAIYDRFWQQSIGHIILALPELDEIIGYTKRSKFRFTEQELSLIFHRFGFEGLDTTLKYIGGRAHKKTLGDLIPFYNKIHSPRLVVPMLEFAQRESTTLEASAWLQSEGAIATHGLITQTGRRGKKQRWAIEQLRQLHTAGHDAEIEQHLEDASEKIKALVRAEVLDFQTKQTDVLAADDFTAWMRELGEEKDEHGAQPYVLDAKEREFFALDQAPELLVEGGESKLPPELCEALLACCKKGHPERKRKKERLRDTDPVAVKYLERCREGLDPASAAAWAWYVLERWWAQGVPDAQSWCVWMIGHLGDSSHATLLVDRIKQHKSWFGVYARGNHAVKAIESIRLIGTTQAYAALFTLRETVRMKKLQRAARAALAQVMRDNKWSESELQDRIVPTGGLDERGTRIFDYGPRQFKLVFRGAFDMEFVDEDGKHFARIPAVRKSDDIDKVTQAKADYKVVRTQLVRLIDEQTTRFTEALQTGKVWRERDWRAYILEHPLLMHFAHKLLWATCEANGELGDIFLPRPDQTQIDADYEPVEFGDRAHVRLLHPAELTDEATRQEWADVMMDFEIVQPIAQLDHEVHRPGVEADALIEELPGLIDARYWWGVNSQVQSELGPEWHTSSSDSRIGMIWRELDAWTIVYNLNNSNWDDPEGAELASGLYFIRGKCRTASKRATDLAEVPAWLYSEAVLAISRINKLFR